MKRVRNKGEYRFEYLFELALNQLGRQKPGQSPYRIAAMITGTYVVAALIISYILVLIINLIWTPIYSTPAFPSFVPSALVVIGTVPILGFPLNLYIIKVVWALSAARQNLKQTASDLEAASRMKSVFLASTSHEIRTPLNGIVGMSELLSRSELTHEQREQVKILREASNSLSVLLGDILDVSKVEAGRMTIFPEPTDLHSLLQTNMSLWTAHAEKKGIRFSSTTWESVPQWLSCDGERVKQCLNNLSSNAIKFTDEGAVTIHATAERMNDGRFQIAVSVMDTGPGLDSSEITRLFQPFEQLGAQTSRKGGTGLGLVISQRLAQLMEGDIAVQSRKGQGSTFTFTFVAEEVEAVLEKAKRAPSESTEALRLLIADDNATNRMVARLLLTEAGHNVVTVEGGKQALGALASSTFDAVLLDIHMPDMDGPETLKRIRNTKEVWSQTPVIALTADAMSGDRARYIDLGMDGYAVKPIVIEDLVAEITNVVEHAGDLKKGLDQSAVAEST